MRSLPYTPNAIWWGQMHLLGGPGRLMAFNAAYLAILVGAAVGFRYVDRSIPITSYCDAAVLVLTIVQSALIVFGACSAVFRAFNRDLNTRMFESHRLSPASSASVIVGYLVGSNLQLLSMYVIGAVVGTVIIRWGTIGVGLWVYGNLYLLLVAPSVWSVTLLLGMGRKKPINPATILFLFFVASPLILTSPGLGLLSGVYAGFVGTRMMIGQTVVSTPAAMCLLLVSVGMTVIWTRAAMRRFRRPDLPAFGVVRGLGMLVIWLVTNALGLALSDAKTLGNISLAPAGPGIEFTRTVLTVTAAGGMLVALLPISAIAHVHCRFRRDRASRLLGRRVPATSMPLVCAALVIVFTFVPATRQPWEVVVTAALSVWAALTVLEGLLRVSYARKKRAATLIVIYVVVFWGVPALVDLWFGEMQSAAATAWAEPRRSAFFGLSPIGALARFFFELDFNGRPGLVVQLLVALAAWWAGGRALRRPPGRR